MEPFVAHQNLVNPSIALRSSLPFACTASFFAALVQFSAGQSKLSARTICGTLTHHLERDSRCIETRNWRGRSIFEHPCL